VRIAPDRQASGGVAATKSRSAAAVNMRT
jgi:hypothetical protein